MIDPDVTSCPTFLLPLTVKGRCRGCSVSPAGLPLCFGLGRRGRKCTNCCVGCLGLVSRSSHSAWGRARVVCPCARPTKREHGLFSAVPRRRSHHARSRTIAPFLVAADSSCLPPSARIDTPARRYPSVLAHPTARHHGHMMKLFRLWVRYTSTE